MSGENFLKQKYNLHTAEEVQSAAERTKKRTGNKVSEQTDALIQNYLNRFSEILSREDPKKRQQGIEAFRSLMHQNYVIAMENIPESAFLLEQKIARELGHGDVEITDQFRKEKSAQIINDQQHSLDAWIDYLSSPDALYPLWAKYWVYASMVKMGKFEKKMDQAKGTETAQFKKREKNTVTSFPPLNSRALAMTIGVMQTKVEEDLKKKNQRISVENKSVQLDDGEFQKLLATENFSKLYTQFLMEIPEYSLEGLQETRGSWVMYKQGSEPDALVKSLDGHPLEWCTANKDTARTQLQGGDFYIYYSLDSNKNPTIPRVAIRMEGEKIAEVKGIAHNQHLDPFIGHIVDAKLAQFSDGIAYQKKSADMHRLTYIENKTNTGALLIKDDLLFLYEQDNTIEGFGYNKDPRIVEIREKRNPEKDMLVIFNCTEADIARTPKEITEHTKAYVGPLETGIFDVLPASCTHIYTSFPEGRIRLESLEVGGLSAAELEQELDLKNEHGKKKYNVSDYARSLLRNKTQFIDPVDARNQERKGMKETVDLVRLHVGDLGFTSAPTTTQLFKKVKDLGLELCPPEIGAYQRLKDVDQPFGDWYYIGMEPVIDSDGNPGVFKLRRFGGGLVLSDDWARPADRWDPDFAFLFRRCKSAT